MTKLHFSLKELLTFGWQKTKQHAWFIVLTWLIIFIISSAVKHVPLVDMVVGLMILLSVSALSLKVVRNEHFTFHDLYPPLFSPKRVLKFFALSAVYFLPLFAVAALIAAGLAGYYAGNFAVFGVGLVAGVILLLPVLYFAIRFGFFSYVVLEHEELSVKELVKKTLALTSHNFLNTLLLVFVLGLINFVGAVFVVGVIITTPVTIFAMAHYYDKLKGHHTAHHQA